MLFFGIITCTTFFAVIAPQDALLNMFGSNLTEPLANLLVRSWGFLVFIMGALLIYGAFNEETRLLCIITAGVSKVGFLLLIMIFGTNYIETLWVTVVFDLIAVLILATYIAFLKRMGSGGLLLDGARVPCLPSCIVYRNMFYSCHVVP